MKVHSLGNCQKMTESNLSTKKSGTTVNVWPNRCLIDFCMNQAYRIELVINLKPTEFPNKSLAKIPAKTAIYEARKNASNLAL